MADTKISALSALSSANITATDAIPIVDDMSGTPATYRGSVNDLRGSWEFIASVEDSGVSALEIADIPTGFDLHRLMIVNASVATDEVYPIIQVSSDNGSTYENTSYDAGGGAMGIAPGSYLGATLTTGIPLSRTSSGAYMIGNATEELFNFEMQVANLTNASYTKFGGIGYGDSNTTDYRGITGQGSHNSATVMDAIQLICSSGNISGKMVLEGYRY